MASTKLYQRWLAGFRFLVLLLFSELDPFGGSLLLGGVGFIRGVRCPFLLIVWLFVLGCVDECGVISEEALWFWFGGVAMAHC